MDPNVNLVHKYALSRLPLCAGPVLWHTALAALCAAHTVVTSCTSMPGSCNRMCCVQLHKPVSHRAPCLGSHITSCLAPDMAVAHSARGASVWGNPAQDDHQGEPSSQGSQGNLQHAGPPSGGFGQGPGSRATQPPQNSAWGGPSEPSPAQVPVRPAR